MMLPPDMVCKTPSWACVRRDPTTFPTTIGTASSTSTF